MLEEGEIDEDTTTQPQSNNSSAAKRSPPKDHNNSNKRKNSNENSNKRAKLADAGADIWSDDEPGQHHYGKFNGHQHGHNNNHNQHQNHKAGGFGGDRDDRAGRNGHSQPVAAAPANSLMSIPMSSLKLVSKTLKENESGSDAAAGSSSGWLSPPKRDQAPSSGGEAKRSGPPSIFDLITTSTLQSPTSGSTSSDKLTSFLHFDSSQMQAGKASFVDPIITEKENKPKSRNNNHAGGFGGGQGTPGPSERGEKRKFNKGGHGAHDGFGAGGGPHFEVSDKKSEKKRKYFEERAKRDAEQAGKFASRGEREPIVCKFYLEGRCQKGDECPFSHNAQLNKRLEVCKYYLNGFCAKKDQCLYMHSDFPCKFYHRVNRETGQRRSECLHGSQCRFSHEPIKNPMLKEAFEKYLAETDESASAKNGGGSKYSDHSSSSSSSTSSSSAAASSIPSLMTLPVAPAPIVTTTASKSGAGRPLGSPSNPSSPPPLQAPLPLLATSIMSLDRAKASPAARFQDIDERDVVKPSASATGDIDERAVVVPPPAAAAAAVIAPVLGSLLAATVASVKVDVSSYNADKDRLIALVMKSIADDGSVFSQIPKQTLSELLLKLLQNKPENQLSHETIKTLLSTFTSVAAPANPNANSPTGSASAAALKGSAKNGREGQLRRKSTYSDYDDDEEEEDDENNLVIEGNVGEIPYRIYEIDVEPSSLWTDPPSNSMASLLAASLGNPEDAIDQESDPRIKYYANKANLMNVANFQMQAHLQSQQQQQQLLTPSSPSHTAAASQSPSTASSSLSDLVKASKTAPAPAPAAAASAASAAPVRLDPRLARSINAATNAASPTRSLSPQPGGGAGVLDLQDLQSLTSGSNLLASLPDFQLPKDLQTARGNGSLSSLLSAQQQAPASTTSHDSSTVKLSIEDYKRKLQKPNGAATGLTNSLNSIMSTVNAASGSNLASLAGSLGAASSQSTAPAVPSSSPTIPGMPSMYSVNLQAPQSLHELLRNFQS